METSRQLTQRAWSELISSSEGSPARTSAWLESGAPCTGTSSELRTLYDLVGYLWRMSQDCSVLTWDAISGWYLKGLRNSGMGWRGGCLTLSTSEYPSDAVASSLSDILEHRVPQRFFLSPRACRGILRRAEKRGRKLPEALRRALATTAAAAPEAMEPTTLRTDSRRTTAETTTRQPTSSEPTTFTMKKRGMSGLPISPEPYKLQATPQTNFKPLPSRSQRTLSMAPQTDEMGETGTNSNEPAPSMQGGDQGPVLDLLSVRRLTPTECERLQGFPDGWTVPDTEPSETP